MSKPNPSQMAVVKIYKYVNKPKAIYSFDIFIIRMKMSSSSCIFCDQEVRPRQEALSCDGCQRWQHRVCNIAISREEYRSIVKEGREVAWRCQECVVVEMLPSVVETHQPMEEEEAPRPMEEEEALRPMEIDTGDGRNFIEERRLNLAENTFEDEAPLDTVGYRDVKYEVVQGASLRQKDLLVDNVGYSYTCTTKRKETVYWRCSVRSKTLTCPATVTQKSDVFVCGRHPHNHPARPGLLEGVKCSTALK